MDTTIRESIINWFKTQEYWVQFASKKILDGESFSEVNLGELFSLFKSDDGRKTGELVDFSSFSTQAFSDHILKIESIGEIHGIDNLSPKTPLEFGGDLSVVYGNNGSGKSGYTRILNKACGKTTVSLLSNVFKDIPEKQSCLINFSVDGKLKEINWDANASHISELETVDIFDSNSGGIYLEGDNEASYVPIEVSLFEKLVKIFNFLKGLLDKDMLVLPSKLPAKPIEHNNSKYIKGMYLNLKHTTDIEALKSFYNYTEEDDAAFKSLAERIKTAPSTLANQKQNRKIQLVDLLKLISERTMLVNSESCKEILNLYLNVEDKRKGVNEAANALSASSSLDGIGSQTWKNMWIAAKEYSQKTAYQEQEFPNITEGSVCVLCQQDLGEESKTKLLQFESYISSQMQLHLKEAEEKYNDRINLLPQDISENDIKTKIEACQLEQEKWLPILKETFSSIKTNKLKIISKEINEMSGYCVDPIVLNDLKEIIETLSVEITVHQEDEKSFNMEKTQIEQNDLKAKKWASSYLEAMLEEVERLKQIEKINDLKKLVSTNSLSRKAGEVSVKVLTESYVSRFNSELESLGAENIAVELIKSGVTRGKVKHKLQLKNLNTSFTKKHLTPLSDGEKRIISLAAFLADVMGKPYKSPFVFDDPISSLDQTYEESTANRLIELSKDRQVIVFTHRLSLLSFLCEADNTYSKYIKSEFWGCGEHGDIPLFAKKPVNAIRNLKNDRLVKAKKVLEEQGSEFGNPLLKSICSDMRILLERVIELELLGGIVQRHKRGITTKDKLSRLVHINSSDSGLLEGLMTEFSKYEHSQSEESPITPPTPAVLESLIDSLLGWHEEFKKR